MYTHTCIHSTKISWTQPHFWGFCWPAHPVSSKTPLTKTINKHPGPISLQRPDPPLLYYISQLSCTLPSIEPLVIIHPSVDPSIPSSIHYPLSYVPSTHPSILDPLIHLKVRLGIICTHSGVWLLCLKSQGSIVCRGLVGQWALATGPDQHHQCLQPPSNPQTAIKCNPWDIEKSMDT